MNWLSQAREGVAVAFGALRADRMRATLAVLGIAIGVATVMLMTGLLTGIRTTMMDEVAAANPDAFTVQRYTAWRLAADERSLFGGNPVITLDERALIATLPTVRAALATLYVRSEMNEVYYEGKRVYGINIFGKSADWPSLEQGNFIDGFNFLAAQDANASLVIVLSASLARAIAGRVDLVGHEMKIAGHRFSVVGVFDDKHGPFGSSIEKMAWIPVTTAIRRLGARSDYLSLYVIPRAGVGPTAAMDEVISVLRTKRHLRPTQANTFELTTNAAALELFSRWSGAFFLVMLLLSSLGLLVGGVGVVAIMMISVTERTPEIGMRKAVGATNRTILWQFLVESVTVTLCGGVLGMIVGGSGALLIAAFSPIPAAIPLWSVLAALAVSVVSGIGFGLYPAMQAARLDPVEALRYE
jgi:putative ABC transport system permease protein